MSTDQNARERFLRSLDEFIRTGNDLVEAWDSDGFNADDAAPLPERLRPPLSLDEWLPELSEHYRNALGGHA